MSRPSPRSASLDDFWKIPEGERFHELIRGELLPKASPSGEHGAAQAGVVSALACEILSSSNPKKDDTVKKLRLYHQVGIPHYWIVDPREATLTVMRWSRDGYVTLLRAERDETVRAEPFEAIELAVGTLFGDDPA